MKETIGFIGLGNMGLAIATNLLKAGFGMRVYNRSAEKARPLLEQGASLVRSPAEAAVPGGVVVTMVSDDRAVEAVTLGAERLAGSPGRRCSPRDEHDCAADHEPACGPPPGTWRRVRCLAGLRQARGRGRGEAVGRDLRRRRGTSTGATAPGGDKPAGL